MSALEAGAAFAAGLTTSIGPCVAPRYLALTAMVANTSGSARWIRIGLFVAGLLACYALLATTASLIGVVTSFSRIIYLALAIGFLILGLHALVAREICTHSHPQPSSGAAALSGGALGLVLSPCCTPVVAMMATVSASQGTFATSLAGVLAFAAGHVAPLATIGLGLGGAQRIVPIRVLSSAASTIGGALSLALATYYGFLA